MRAHVRLKVNNILNHLKVIRILLVLYVVDVLIETKRDSIVGWAGFTQMGQRGFIYRNATGKVQIYNLSYLVS